MDFSNVDSINGSQGEISSIIRTSDGTVLWSKPQKYYWVKLYSGTGGTVGASSPAVVDGEYWKSVNQNIEIYATPNTNYTFGSWSDGGAQTHSVSGSESKTETTTYVASFNYNPPSQAYYLSVTTNPSTTYSSENHGGGNLNQLWGTDIMS